MVLVCLRKWGHLMVNGCHQFFIDNIPTVDSLYSGRSHNPFWQSLLREITILTTCLNITFKPSHLPGLENRIADLLSRAPHDVSSIENFRSLADASGFPNPIQFKVLEEVFHLDSNL
jgi:hypothetical protein